MNRRSRLCSFCVCMETLHEYCQFICSLTGTTSICKPCLYQKQAQSFTCFFSVKCKFLKKCMHCDGTETNTRNDTNRVSAALQS